MRQSEFCLLVIEQGRLRLKRRAVFGIVLSIWSLCIDETLFNHLKQGSYFLTLE